MDIDLSSVAPQYCSDCKTKKTPYIGKLFGTDAVLYKQNCSCESYRGRKLAKSDTERFNELQTPYWKLMGLKPKPHEKQLEKYLKDRGMTYGDWRRERDYHSARNPSALPEFNAHVKKYGYKSAPTTEYQKS